MPSALLQTIGTLMDLEFLTITFTDADLVYTMLPPANYFNPELDLDAHCEQLGRNFSAAIRRSGVKRAIHLSSIGADLAEGSGLIRLHHRMETILNELPDVDITFMRPTGFYYNLFGYVQMTKNRGVIAANYGETE